MPRYPLHDLLRVRQYREDNASQAVMRRRKQVAEAEEEVRQRTKEAEEFHEWRLKREDELYAELMNKKVHRQDIDDLKLKIEGLRAEEVAKKEKILEAERHLEASRKALQEAQAALVTAQRDRQKITEHKELWLQEAARESESRQDKELEEFKAAIVEFEEYRSEDDDDGQPDQSW